MMINLVSKVCSKVNSVSAAAALPDDEPDIDGGRQRLNATSP